MKCVCSHDECSLCTSSKINLTCPRCAIPAWTMGAEQRLLAREGSALICPVVDVLFNSSDTHRLTIKYVSNDARSLHACCTVKCNFAEALILKDALCNRIAFALCRQTEKKVKAITLAKYWCQSLNFRAVMTILWWLSCRCEGFHWEEGSADPSRNWDGLCGVKVVERICLQQSQHQGDLWLRRKLQHLSVQTPVPKNTVRDWSVDVGVRQEEFSATWMCLPSYYCPSVCAHSFIKPKCACSVSNSIISGPYPKF